MKNVKKGIFEIASEDKVLLNLIKTRAGELLFKKRLRELQNAGKIYAKLEWQNQYQTFFNSLDNIEQRISFITSQYFSDPNNKQLQSWLNQLQILLPKIQQAKQDCLNKLWNWLDIKW